MHACLATYAGESQIERMPDFADAAVLKAEQLQSNQQNRH